MPLPPFVAMELSSHGAASGVLEIAVLHRIYSSFRAGICSIAVLGSSCLWWRQQFGAAAAVSSASHAGNQGPTGAGGDNADPVQRCILFCRHPGDQKGCYLE